MTCRRGVLVVLLLFCCSLSVTRTQGQPTNTTSGCTLSLESLELPSTVILFRHANRLPVDEYTSGPSLSPAGFARAFAFVSYYLENIQPFAGLPDYIIALRASTDYDSAIHATYSYRELETVGPLLTYVYYVLPETATNVEQGILYSNFYGESQTPEMACYLYNQTHLANKTVLVNWDHKTMPVLVDELLSMFPETVARYSNNGSLVEDPRQVGFIGETEYSKIIVLDYAGGINNVTVTVMNDGRDYESMDPKQLASVYEKYATLFPNLYTPSSSSSSSSPSSSSSSSRDPYTIMYIAILYIVMHAASSQYLPTLLYQM